MNLEEHIRRCYAHDLPDASLDSADQALVVYRSGYLEGLKDGQQINGEVDALQVRKQSKLNFDRGYAQGIAYGAFAASHVGFPEGMLNEGDYMLKMNAAKLMRDAITAALEGSAAAARKRSAE